MYRTLENFKAIKFCELLKKQISTLEKAPKDDIYKYDCSHSCSLILTTWNLITNCSGLKYMSRGDPKGIQNTK